MNAAFEKALAELRAVPMREQSTPEPQPANPEGCCSGDRRGYQWHQRTRNLPACGASLEANRLYMREALRKFRARRPSYHRDWRAQRRSESGGGR